MPSRKARAVNGFHLTVNHIQAIQAQIDLIELEGGFGEVRIVLEAGRIARLGTTTSVTVHDEPKAGVHTFRRTAAERMGTERR